MWKMTFEIFIKSLRFETPWAKENGFYKTDCLSVVVFEKIFMKNQKF